MTPVPQGSVSRLLSAGQHICAKILSLIACRWRDSCQKYHPTWQHMFWDNAAAEQLLVERYPWFLDTWRMYPRVVHRGEGSCPIAHPHRPATVIHMIWDEPCQSAAVRALRVSVWIKCLL